MAKPTFVLCVLSLIAGCMIALPEPYTYAWQSSAMSLPPGVTLGNTHGCVDVANNGDVYLCTDSKPAIFVFDANGVFKKNICEDLSGGLHGLEIVQEGDTEYLFVAHTAQHQVQKRSLDGEVLLSVAWPQESGKYNSADEYAPTSVTVLPDGRFMVADGYGKSWVHIYDAEGNWQSCFGGWGSEAGKFKTPHGISYDAYIDKVVVADRENRRLQLFNTDGTFSSSVPAVLNRPCHVDVNEDGWLVAELEGRVTILNREGEVLKHLGEQPDPTLRATNRVDYDKWSDGIFLSPHCAAWGKNGDIWVSDWNFRGRLSHLTIER